MRGALLPLAAIAAGCGVAYGAAAVAGTYWGLVFLTALLQGTLVLSYDLLGGYGGELNLGHGLFFGLGAYAAAIGLNLGLQGWAAALLSGAAGAVFALALTPVLIPLTGVAFALGSLVSLLFCGLMARNLEWATGGTAGLSFIPQWGLPRSLTAAAALFGVAFWVHDRQRDSRIGRALRACAVDAGAAGMMGVDAKRVRGVAFVLGSVLASLAGGIYPLYFAYVSPQSGFGLETALAPVVMVLVGGPGSRFGPLLGLALLTGLQEWLWTGGLQWRLALWGGVLVVSGALLPNGLAGIRLHCSSNPAGPERSRRGE
jgi:branched-chain amino acid transport system permease protein